jgi:hypothetical protein
MTSAEGSAFGATPLPICTYKQIEVAVGSGPGGFAEGRRLAAIHTLDIFDKHRELMITVASVYQASTHGPSPLPQSSIEFTQLPMGPNSQVRVRHLPDKFHFSGRDK